MNQPRWNLRLFFWIIERIFRHPNYMILPWYLIALRWVLTPLEMLRWKIERGASFSYDAMSDVFTIYGIKYTGSLFRALGIGSVRPGAIIQIIKRETDGSVFLRELYPQIIYVSKAVKSLREISIEMEETGETLVLFRRPVS